MKLDPLASGFFVLLLLLLFFKFCTNYGFLFQLPSLVWAQTPFQNLHSSFIFFFPLLILVFEFPSLR